MKNSDKPINPIFDSHGLPLDDNQIFKYKANGLTKREYACIKLGIPESGDEEIDDLIKKSERKRIAGLAMQAMVTRDDICSGFSLDMAKQCIYIADELLKQLENDKH